MSIKKANIKAKGPLGQYHAGAPMEKIHIDILGPLNESRLGNKYILVMVDQFTKWIEMFALPNQSALTVAKAAVNGFMSRMGCPIQIHTDQGKNFDGHLFKNLCQLLEIVKTRTTPYRPSSNGQVERYNSIILQAIRCYLKGKQKDWDENLQQLAGAIRATENRQTGFTPNQMMLGREVIQPVDLLTGTCNLNLKIKEPGQFITDLKDTLEKVHSIARENLQAAQFRQKKTYDIKLYNKTYNVGDVVFKIDSTTRIGQSKKLRAPYLVIQVLSPVLYRIKHRKKEMVIHHDQLKPCDDRNLPLWIIRLRNALFQEEIKTSEEAWNDMTEDSFSEGDFEIIFSDNEGLAEGDGSAVPFSQDQTTDALELDQRDNEDTVDLTTKRDGSAVPCSQDPSDIVSGKLTDRSTSDQKNMTSSEDLIAGGDGSAVPNSRDSPFTVADLEYIENNDLDDTFLYAVDDEQHPVITDLDHLPRSSEDINQTFLYDLGNSAAPSTGLGQRRRRRPRHFDDFLLD